MAEKYKKYVDLIHADRSYVTRDEFRQHTGVSITHLDEWHYRVYDKNKLSEWLKECGSGMMTYPYLGVNWRERGMDHISLEIFSQNPPILLDVAQ